MARHALVRLALRFCDPLRTPVAGYIGMRILMAGYVLLQSATHSCGRLRVPVVHHYLFEYATCFLCLLFAFGLLQTATTFFAFKWLFNFPACKTVARPFTTRSRGVLGTRGYVFLQLGSSLASELTGRLSYIWGVNPGFDFPRIQKSKS